MSNHLPDAMLPCQVGNQIGLISFYLFFIPSQFIFNSTTAVEVTSSVDRFSVK